MAVGSMRAAAPALRGDIVGATTPRYVVGVAGVELVEDSSEEEGEFGVAPGGNLPVRFDGAGKSSRGTNDAGLYVGGAATAGGADTAGEALVGGPVGTDDGPDVASVVQVPVADTGRWCCRCPGNLEP
jgi:hypothetical protein